MSDQKVKAVFDCIVFLQGVASRNGPARSCLELVDAGKVILCLSPAILREIAEVLSRPLLQQKFPAIGAIESEALLRSIRAKARMFIDPPNVLILPRDRDDEIYLDLAAEAQADYLVTWNERHLTYLMRKDTPEGIEFAHRIPVLTIIDPVKFLHFMRSREP